MSEQDENLERVSHRIRPAIWQFYQSKKLKGQPRFFAAELRDFVVRMVGHALAPASPDRVLRDLRRKHVLDYRVVSRSQSIYEFLWSDQLEML